MASIHDNPFQGIRIRVPIEYHSDGDSVFETYCQGNANTSTKWSPFPRMIDFWFLSICVAIKLGLKPVVISNDIRVKEIVDGSVLSSDPWRIEILKLIAIELSGNTQIVSEPEEIIKLVNSYAYVGIPKVVEMLKSGDDDPIWNLSDAVDGLIRKSE